MIPSQRPEIVIARLDHQLTVFLSIQRDWGAWCRTTGQRKKCPVNLTLEG